MTVLGWDIGGSNTKVCRVEHGRAMAALARPFEVKDALHELPRFLHGLAAEAVGEAKIDAHAVTMTAELSRNFLTKREGVARIAAAVRAAFPPPAPVYLFTVAGALVPIDDEVDALQVASANWMATARLVAETCPDALLVDVGSTTADIIPIAGGRVVNHGWTDPERLASGELVYTGVLRTPVEGLAHDVEIAGTTYGVAAEGFATSGDVYVCLRDLTPDAYAGPTADGRPAAVPCAADRLRRALCADSDLMPDSVVDTLARAFADAQVARIAAAIGRVGSRHPSIDRAVVVGLGAFVAARAARAAGLEVDTYADGREELASRCAPAAAVAILLERTIGGHGDDMRTASPRQPFGPRPAIERVVKVGGGLLADPEALKRVLAEVEPSAGALVVPGGGPFADAVRVADRAVKPGDDAAHWMAVLAMDQYAEVLLAHLCAGTRVETLAEARQAIASRRVPVLAPSRWLRHADPLPHSWDVTSDSIAAWVAGQAGASMLVLVKPPGATGALVDPYFARALPSGVTCEIVAADELTRLKAALGAAPGR